MNAAIPSTLDLAKDRRVLSRLFPRLLLMLVAARAAVELTLGSGVALAGGVDPGLAGLPAWVAALLHLGVGAALLHPVTRRGGAAGLAALLLGWLAWLGTTARQVEAVVPAVLLMFALGAARPEDEGPFRPRSRGWVKEVWFALHVAGLGLAAFWVRDHLWTATALGKAVFGYGAAAVHVWHWQVAGNTSPGNVGFRVLVLGDLILPTVLVVLVVLWLRGRGAKEPSRREP